jgi:RNA polymerase sigma-70 factor (ECF subfamily)
MADSAVLEPPAPTAAALARLAESRDREAWRLLVERHGAAMYRAALAITRDEHLAADACQEAFLLVRDGAKRFRPRGDDAEAAAQGWLIRVATTTALMLLRGTRRRRRREAALPEALALPTRTSASESDERLAVALRDEVAALPETYREALLLHVYAGLDYGAIAGAIGTSEGNARVRVHRAVARLRSRLTRLGAAAFALPTLPAAVPPPALAARCISLLHAPITPAVPMTALTGGLTLMTKLAITAAALVVGVSLALPFASARAEDNGGPNKPEEHHDRPGATTTEEHHDKPADKGDYQTGEKGTFVGTVAEVNADKGAFAVVGADGKRMRFIPQWKGGMPKDGGGFDKDILAKIRALKQGDKVSVDWLFEEHLRALAITVLEGGNGANPGRH